MAIWNDLWEFFFPRYCVVCGKRLLQGEEHVCSKCFSGLPRTRLHLRPENDMEKNLWGKLPLERASAYLYYAKEGDVSRLLYELKYYGNAHIGHYLGRCMATDLSLSGFFRGIDYVIPVPLHKAKRRKRGYNQSEMLVEGIASVTGIPIFRDLLVRSRYTETQTRKGGYERWLNVQDVFECTSGEALKDKHVLLVDDVMTTGATIVACADSLAGIPGLRISVLTLALAGYS